MKRNFKPFGPRKTEIVKVGGGLTSDIFMLKKGHITIRENPIDVQESSRYQARLSSLIDSAVKRLMTEKSIIEDEARILFFGNKVDANTTVEPSVSLFDYLDDQQRVDYFALVNDVSNKIKIATVFLQTRLAYHVVCVFDFEGDSPVSAIAVEPLRYSLNAGSVLKFSTAYGEVKVTLSDYADEDAEVIKIEPKTLKLSKGDVGCLLDDKGKYLVGLPGWEEDDTRSDLSMAEVDAIYTFYQSELGIAKGEDEGKALSQSTKESPSTDSTPNQSLLNGSSTIGESNPTESPTPVSA